MFELFNLRSLKFQLGNKPFYGLSLNSIWSRQCLVDSLSPYDYRVCQLDSETNHSNFEDKCVCKISKKVKVKIASGFSNYLVSDCNFIKQDKLIKYQSRNFFTRILQYSSTFEASFTCFLVWIYFWLS